MSGAGDRLANSRVALTGATGKVGRFICDYLGEQGCEVKALVRPGTDRGGFARAPSWIEGRMAEESALVSLLHGADAVVHCAFSHKPGHYRGGEGQDLEGFWRTNFGGTVRLLRLARASGVRRVVLLSSRAVFAHRQPWEDPHAPVTDSYPVGPDSQYGALKAAEEALAAAAVDMEVCALRPTGVYGLGHPRQTSKWFDLVRDVLSGQTVTGSRTATEVHGRDVAQAVACLLQAPSGKIRGQGFNCSDLTLSTRELVALIARQASVAAPLPAPSPPVVNPMKCDRLEALGWRPGGMALLRQTLEELIGAVRQVI